MRRIQRYAVITTIIIAVGSMLIADNMLAQQRGGGQRGAGQRGGQGGGRRGESSFAGQVKQNDANRDGKLTMDEINSPIFSKSLFEAIDTNGDGGISLEEAIAADNTDKYKGVAKRVEFEGKTWIADHAIGAKVVQHKGKQALHIVGREQCYVYLPIDNFQDGTIEVDMAGDVFTGICFRGRDGGKRAEKLYFRPQNANTEKHQNTVQYAVLGREDGHWSALRRNFPGKYETGADIKKGEWFHARFEIKGKSLKVYVNDAAEPVLTVNPVLDGVTKGSVGLWGWDSYFANFKYTPAK